VCYIALINQGDELVQNLSDLGDIEVSKLASNLSQIVALAEKIVANGTVAGFEIYRLARDTRELLVFDRISRDTLAKLSAPQCEVFKGYTISPVALDYIRAGQKINAIREMRNDHGLDLLASKTLVEEYGLAHGYFR
jgi:ribosomal protein L7/L12